jgi:hypothetical protein
MQLIIHLNEQMHYTFQSQYVVQSHRNQDWAGTSLILHQL